MEIPIEPRPGASKPPTGKPQINTTAPNDTTGPSSIALQAATPQEIENLNVILPNFIGVVFACRSARAKEEIMRASHAMSRIVRNPVTGQHDLVQAFEEMAEHPFFVVIDAACPAQTLEINGQSCVTVNNQFRGFNRIFDSTATTNETRFYFRDGALDADKFFDLCEPEHDSRGIAKAIQYVVEFNKRSRAAWAAHLKKQTGAQGHRLTPEQLDEARFASALAQAGIKPSTARAGA